MRFAPERQLYNSVGNRSVPGSLFLERKRTRLAVCAAAFSVAAGELLWP
jgi:hypothetical protein